MTVATMSKMVNPEGDDGTVFVVIGRLDANTATAVPPFWPTVVGVDLLIPFTVAETV